MIAVAIWDRRPGARELLDARLARGWRPLATRTRGGAKVLGYAACVFGHGPARGALADSAERPLPG